MTTIRQLGRITTGVPGLDFVTAGGFFETGVYIVQGAAGSGKTILANQICFHQAQLQRRAIYYTLDPSSRMIVVREAGLHLADVVPRSLR